jgi:chromosome segregation ATPase
MQSMVDDYDAKTLQNKDLNRQISTLTLTHTECEAQWETARTAHAQELQTARSAHAKELQTVRSAHAQELQTVRSAHAQELRTREAEKQLAQSSEFEDLQAAYFRAQQQLLAVEHAKATESSLNMNVDTLKKENTALRLNQQRIQDRHDVLMTTCADAKAKTRLVQEQLAKIQCEFLNLETLSVQHENTITRFKSELEDKHHEISKLTAALKECGATSGDALENALSEKILHLEETNGRLRHELKTAHSELEDVKRCADATKASLAGVIASIVGVTAKATL